MNLLYKHFVLVILTPLLIAGGLLMVTPVTAQTNWGPDDEQESAWGESSWDNDPSIDDPRTDDPASTRVPDWADSGSFDADGADRYDFGDEIQPHAPPPPPAPDPVPVDGGLSLLVLAGAGYAAHKLRRRDDEEGEDEDAMP